MTELDRLPPDQRAVLSLVLDRGKSYAEVAELLGISERTVRDRAHTALDALADHETWTAEPPPATSTRAASPAADASAEPAARATRQGSANRPEEAQPGDRAKSPLASPSSRIGGALLLGAIVAAIVVAVILISGGGGGKSSGQASKTATGTSSSSTSTTSAGKPSLNKKIVLSPIEPTLKAGGTAYVLSENKRHAFYVAARGLPPSNGFFYAVWLYNSPSSSKPLGRAPTVGADGRMEGGGPLPTNASLYHQLIITKENSTHPPHPGQIVLKGTFALH
jgi:hypothetical protein